MKKSLFLFIPAVTLSAGLVFNSCESAPSTKVELKTYADTLSYSFGASISESLPANLQQSGLITDTMSVYSQYSMLINVADDAKKPALQQEMRSKIDSIHKANVYTIENFLKGFKDGLNSRESQSSYNLGLSFGSQIAHQAIPGVASEFLDADKNQDVSKAAVLAAVSATLQKKPLVLKDATSYLRNIAQQKQMEAQNKQMEAQRVFEEQNKIKGEQNKEEGAKFLAENKKKDGVVTLPSGLQYKVIKQGTGAKPTIEDVVVCDYNGELLDGTVFDSSIVRGEPAQFPLQGVIPGWTEVLQLMPVGSKWEVYIPSNLAYGEFGAGEKIGPNATLKFDIELLDIVK